MAFCGQCCSVAGNAYDTDEPEPHMETGSIPDALLPICPPASVLGKAAAGSLNAWAQVTTQQIQIQLWFLTSSLAQPQPLQPSKQ